MLLPRTKTVTDKVYFAEKINKQKIIIIWKRRQRIWEQVMGRDGVHKHGTGRKIDDVKRRGTERYHTSYVERLKRQKDK